MALILRTNTSGLAETVAKATQFARKAGRLTAVIQGSTQVTRWAFGAAIASQFERDVRRATYNEMNARHQEAGAGDLAWLVSEPGVSLAEWLGRNPAATPWLKASQWLVFAEDDVKAMDRLDAASRSGNGLPFPFLRLETVIGITIEAGPPDKRDPQLLPGSNFLVILDGATLGFSSISSFVSPAQGRPGLARMRRAVSGDRTLSDWQLTDEAHLAPPRIAEIVLLDSPGGKEAARWVLTGCMAVRWEGPELDAMQNSIATETLEFSYRGLFRV